jgi:carboxyl-terminal processing protease
MVRSLKAFLLIGIAMVTGLTAGGYVTRAAWAKGVDKYSDLDTLAQALHHIESQYLDQFTTRDIIYGAIDGMMDSLDQHSVFLDPSQMKSAEVRTEGFFSGIGIEVKWVHGKIKVVRVVPKAPAEGRLQRGDILLEVAGSPTETLTATSDALQGEPGSSVHLKFQRGDETREETIVRARLRDRTVRVEKLDHNWAYAEISRFQRNTASDLERGLRKTDPSKGLILDLRGNGGGLLDEAVDVVDLFATNGLIVETRGRNGAVLERHDAGSSAPFKHLKIIILVNGESASASEIVSGALRALINAELVGSQTWGKWSVQRLYVFEDHSAIKLTVARYFLPEQSEPVDEIGLEPDHIIEQHTDQSLALKQLKARLASDSQSQALLDIVTQRLQETPGEPYLGSLTDRLTHDPQLEAAWTLARANH